MPFNLVVALPLLLPRAIAWAETQAELVRRTGTALSIKQMAVARVVGVKHPERIVVLTVDTPPMPDDPMLREAAVQTGFLGPSMAGLTLGHSILIVRGQMSLRLLSHECRHVHQYEQYGSIANFLPAYLSQIATVGYDNAPLEIDATQHELSGT